MKIRFTRQPFEIGQHGSIGPDGEFPCLVDDPVPVRGGPESSQGTLVIDGAELKVLVLPRDGLALDPFHKDPALPLDDLFQRFSVLVVAPTHMLFQL